VHQICLHSRNCRVTCNCLLLSVLARNKHSEIAVSVIKRVAELWTFRLYRDLKEQFPAFSCGEAGSIPKSGHVKFVVDRMTLEQAFGQLRRSVAVHDRFLLIQSFIIDTMQLLLATMLQAVLVRDANSRQGQGIFFLEISESHRFSYSMGTGYLPTLKWSERDTEHWPLSSADFKYEWSCTASSLLLRDLGMDNFTAFYSTSLLRNWQHGWITRNFLEIQSYLR